MIQDLVKCRPIGREDTLQFTQPKQVKIKVKWTNRLGNL